MFTTDAYPVVFKKGQKLRFTGTCPSRFLKAGEVYTVADAGADTLVLHEVFGSIFQPRFFEVIEEAPTATETTAQEKAIVGGLQAHSVGSCYPFAFVGYGNGDRVVYCLENLQTGEVACTPQGTPYQFYPRAEEVAEVLRHYKQHMQKGRPTFTSSGRFTLSVPTSRAIKA